MSDDAVIREKVALLIHKHSIATGHGDTVDELLSELDIALTEMRRELRRLHDPFIHAEECPSHWGEECRCTAGDE